MNLHTIPAGTPFLPALARWWLDRGTDPATTADGLFLLPTRRAARALMSAFLEVSDGRPMLLPRITALGAVDEAPLALSGALDLPPAVPPARRLAELTRLIMAMGGREGAPTTADRAWPMAVELASLLDEAHRAEIDLAATLPQAAAIEHAEHWDRTVRFLEIVTLAWPAWLSDNGLIDGADRARRLLDAQGAAWAGGAPHPVIIAGTTGGLPAVARLIRVVAGLPQGRVVLPGVDLDLDGAIWARLAEGLDAGHPQAGFARLLTGMGATRGDVAEWDAPGARERTLAQVMLPAGALGQWRTATKPALDGVWRLHAADEQEEAVAIALILRDALEQPGARAALVTPDRVLAGRVAAELRRYGVIADDSAGEPLADTPPGAFLRLLAHAVADGFSPVALLSVLKHPLAGLGLSLAACRDGARALELACLRGPAPIPGLDGLRAAAHRANADVALLDQLAARCRPLLDIVRHNSATPAEVLRALLQVAESLAETDRAEGPDRLWSGEEGEALSTHLAELLDALPVLPPQPLAVLPGLLDAALAGAMARTRRALRGMPGGIPGGMPGAEHPRVAILGLLEARLLSSEIIVLGGLAEGVWPAAADPGPWMSRPMRAACGLPSPEERVGQAAHDFSMLVSAARTVVLSCPRRRDRVPTVPARWLVRIDAYLAGQGSALPAHPAVGWARALDQPDGPPAPVQAPTPRPPVPLRPRKLSVTQVATWMADPYAIYARHVLRIRPLDPLEQGADQSDYGKVVHAAIADTITTGIGLRDAMERAMANAAIRPALAAWWRPLLYRIADWVADAECRRAIPAHIAAEIPGTWEVPGVRFTLTGRADRIERRADGTLAILDYKTGSVPKKGDLTRLIAPQMALEGAMAGAGAFGPDLHGVATELTYWKLSGGFKPGEESQVPDPETAAADVAQRLAKLVVKYDDPGRAYLSMLHGERMPYPQFSHLARRGEWSAATEEEEEDAHDAT